MFKTAQRHSLLSVGRRALCPAVFACALALLFVRPAFAAGSFKNGADGVRYYENEDGSIPENEWFSVWSVPKEPSQKASETWYYAGEGGGIYRDGWFEVDGCLYYFNSSGSCPRDTVVTVEEKKYYVSAETGLITGGWFSIERTNNSGVPYLTWYYAGEDGSLLFDGWKEIDGSWYYFYTGCNSPRNAWLSLDGGRYYVDEDGVRGQDGWFSISGVAGNGTAYTNWYFADEEGDVLRGGWKELDGSWYFFDNNGLSYRKRWYTDSRKDRYYFDEDGRLQTDWFSITTVNANTGAETVTWYYGLETGGVLRDGYHEVDGETYYFGTNGNLYVSRWMVDAGKGRKYLAADGTMMAGEWFSLSGVNTSTNTEYEYWYYADETGRVLRNGWYELDGKQYYMNSTGQMQTGWIDGNNYYCGEDGAKVFGWQYLELKDGWKDSTSTVLDNYVGNYGWYAWFYFSPELNGRILESSNSTFIDVTIDGEIYCVDERGIIQLGWIRHRSKSPVTQGYKYYAEENSEEYHAGQRVDDGWYVTIGPDEDCTGNEELFYFQSSGYPYCASKADGYLLQTIEGKRYLFDAWGNAKNGLREVDGVVYCFGKGEDEYAALTGVVKIDDGDTTERSELSEYYFKATGAAYTGVHDGKYYYKGKLQKAGADAKYQAFDLPEIGVRLLSSSGKIIKNKTVKDSGDNEWKLAADGEIVAFGTDVVCEVVEPDVETD